jgi:hypothetical protein
MLSKLLDNYSFSSKYIIADPLYSTVKFARYVLNTLHTKVKNKFRRILQRKYKKL